MGAKGSAGLGAVVGGLGGTCGAGAGFVCWPVVGGGGGWGRADLPGWAGFVAD